MNGIIAAQQSTIYSTVPNKQNFREKSVIRNQMENNQQPAFWSWWQSKEKSASRWLIHNLEAIDVWGHASYVPHELSSKRPLTDAAHSPKQEINILCKMWVLPSLASCSRLPGASSYPRVRPEACCYYCSCSRRGPFYPPSFLSPASMKLHYPGWRRLLLPAQRLGWSLHIAVSAMD